MVKLTGKDKNEVITTLLLEAEDIKFEFEGLNDNTRYIICTSDGRELGRWFVRPEVEGSGVKQEDTAIKNGLDISWQTYGDLKHVPSEYCKLSEWFHNLCGLLEARLEMRRTLLAIRDAKETSEPMQIASTANNKKGIDPTVYKRLTATLLNCGPFESGRELKALFIVARIRPWRDNLPEANTSEDRVKGVIDFLYERKSDTGQNALVLFLRVLSELKMDNDACKHKLAELTDILEQESS